MSEVSSAAKQCDRIFNFDSEITPDILFSASSLPSLYQSQFGLKSIEATVRGILQDYWPKYNQPKETSKLAFMSRRYQREKRELADHFRHTKELHAQIVDELRRIFPELEVWIPARETYRTDLRWQKILNRFLGLVPHLTQHISPELYPELQRLHHHIQEVERYQSTVDLILSGKHPQHKIRHIQDLKFNFMLLSTDFLWAYAKLYDLISTNKTDENQKLKNEILKASEEFFLEITVQSFSLFANGYMDSGYLSDKFLASWAGAASFLPKSRVIDRALHLLEELSFYITGHTLAENEELLRVKKTLQLIAQKDNTKPFSDFEEQEIWSTLKQLSRSLMTLNHRFDENSRRKTGHFVVDMLLSRYFAKLAELPKKHRLSSEGRIQSSAFVLWVHHWNWSIENTYILSQLFRPTTDELSLVEPKDILAEPRYGGAIDIMTLRAKFNFDAIRNAAVMVMDPGYYTTDGDVVLGNILLLPQLYYNFVKLAHDVLRAPEVRDLVGRTNPRTLTIIEDSRYFLQEYNIYVNPEFEDQTTEEKSYFIKNPSTRTSLMKLMQTFFHFQTIFDDARPPAEDTYENSYLALHAHYYAIWFSRLLNAQESSPSNNVQTQLVPVNQ